MQEAGTGGAGGIRTAASKSAWKERHSKGCFLPAEQSKGWKKGTRMCWNRLALCRQVETTAGEQGSRVHVSSCDRSRKRNKDRSLS